MRTRLFVVVAVLCLASGLNTFAQSRRDSLSDAEVESIREAAMEPAKRIAAFQKIIDTRIDRIQSLAGKKYEAGRVGDLHDWIEQVGEIAGELEDNLETYAADHRDLRKVLPKLTVAVQRWASVLRQPERNDRYEVARRISLDYLEDVRKETAELLPEQTKYFKEHPPNKDKPEGIEAER